MEAKQTPLIELLERIPQDARLVVEHDQFSSSVHPVGRLCREAAVALRAALAQQAKPKPMSPEQRQRWEELAAMPQQAEPVASLNAWAADRLARHGIPMPETPRCTDCWGIGYDASGQLCGCQGNPSF